MHKSFETCFWVRIGSVAIGRERYRRAKRREQFDRHGNFEKINKTGHRTLCIYKTKSKLKTINNDDRTKNRCELRWSGRVSSTWHYKGNRRIVNFTIEF